MAKIGLTEGFTLIPEGTHVFKITEVNYKEDFHDFIKSSLIKHQAVIRIPCNRILTALAVMFTSCNPEDYPESVTVIHVILSNVVISH